MTAATLAISDLCMEIAGRPRSTPILRGVDLIVRPGEVRGLVGESGGGKTMIGKAVMDLLPATGRITGGSIEFQGRDLLHLPARERRALLGRSISMIPQQPATALNPVLRIEAQLVDVLRHHLKMTRSQARARAVELLELVSIRSPDRVLRQYPHELSGGMCQRVAIAIAFSCNPALIIADEPTTALDVTVQFQILRLIKSLQRDSGAAVLFITHDLGVVAKICDSVSVIFAGRILENSSTERVFAQPKHPYTAALISATPRHDQPEKGLHPVPPSLVETLWNEAFAYDSEHGHA